MANFRRIWAEEGEFLCSRLDSRWLVSACDTIIDHFEERDEVATAVAGTLFMNTVKLYETERLVQQPARGFEEVLGADRRVTLFDGMAAFLVGRGDMVRNMLDRVTRGADSPIASPILKELIRRANTHDTVFKRFRDLHTNPRTLW